MRYAKSETELEIYLETQKRRIYVGKLHYDKTHAHYVFEYDVHYLRSNAALAVGPELPATRLKFVSEKNELFPTFQDRIPDKRNAAYPEYCSAYGISVNERNPIILLGTIGHRGPSSFIYAAVYLPQEDVVENLKAFRNTLSLSQWDIAMLFDLPVLTIQRIEAKKSKDKNSLKLIDLYLSEPQLTIKQLHLTGQKVHRDVLTRVYAYFKKALEDRSH